MTSIYQNRKSIQECWEVASEVLNLTAMTPEAQELARRIYFISAIDMASAVAFANKAGYLNELKANMAREIPEFLTFMSSKNKPQTYILGLDPNHEA